MHTEKLPFLEALAQKLYHKYGKQIDKVTIVFPNKRSGLFFRKYLAQKVSAPVWSPQILSIEVLIQQLSHLPVADSVILIFKLYRIFKKLHPSIEPFDRFYSWGILLLRDFDEIDKYLVQAEQLFTNLHDQKQLEKSFEYLTETQRAAVRSFWKHFDNHLSNAG